MPHGTRACAFGAADRFSNGTLFHGVAFMHARWWSGIVLFGLAFLFSDGAFGADEAKEVPLPKLPQGAGKIDDDAPKTFTKTKSGLKYRILRKGDGKTPT